MVYNICDVTYTCYEDGTCVTLKSITVVSVVQILMSNERLVGTLFTAEVIKVRRN